MEDQLICGALQTLNEEACEDVMEEAEDTNPVTLTLPESDPGERIARLFAEDTAIVIEPEDNDEGDDSYSSKLTEESDNVVFSV